MFALARIALRRGLAPLLSAALLATSQAAEPPQRLPPLFDSPADPYASGVPRDDGLQPAQYTTTYPGDREPVVVLDDPDASPPGPPGARKGVFQKLLLSATWVPAPEEGNFGFTDLESSVVLGFPFPTVKSPLLVTPAFAVHYLDGPASPDLPVRVYSTGTEFRWIRPITECLMADLGVGVGVYSDFEADTSEALRITGRGLGIYKWNERTTFVAGVLYLDRDDVQILPAGGVMWNPNDDWNLELIFPRPKVARRFFTCGTERGLEYWGYVAGEFGGGQWAIATTGGQVEKMVIRDYRVLLGVESKLASGLSTRLETGYVFGREVEFYGGPTPDFEPGDTLLLRAGASY